MTDLPAAPVAPAPTFDQLSLTSEVRRAIDEMGFVTPTPVQLAAYGPAVAGKDLIVQARTGTGKTAAFGIPLVDRLVRSESAGPGRVQALVLAPTRELALQSAREIEKLGKHRGIRTSAVYGGAPMERQVNELAGGAQIVSGTPGRVLDHLRRGSIDARDLKVLVLDEADEMLSMGFAKELNAILENLPAQKQVLFFSATIDDGVKRMADRHMKEPQIIALSSDAVGAETISHFIYMVTGGSRVAELIRILEIEDPESAVIFCNTKAETEKAAAALQAAGFNADWLNGDLPQNDREKVMARTKAGTLRYLVATDVAARGIDISHLTHVINHEFPESAEQYVHRTGRTGRAGRTGTAISLVRPQDLGALYYLRLQFKIFPIERSLPTSGEARTRAELDRVQLLAEAFSKAPAELDRAVARRLLTHEDAERLVAGLLGAFFGTKGSDVDEQAAASRRARAPEPVAEPLAEPTRAAVREPRPTREPRPVREPLRDRPRPPRREEPRAEGTTEPEVPARAAKTVVIKKVTQEDVAAYDAQLEARVTQPMRRHQDAGDSGEGTLRDEDTAMLFLGVGRREGARPGDIGRMLRELAGLERHEIGRIRIRDKHTFVGVPITKLTEVIAKVNGQVYGERTITAEAAKPPRRDGELTE